MLRKDADFTVLERMTADNEAVARDPKAGAPIPSRESACRQQRAVEKLKI
jgi:hypothetical protein